MESGLFALINKLVFVTESTKLELEVVPSSKESKIIGFNDWTKALRIKLKAKARKGAANKELLSFLEETFKTKAKIISGETSRKKTALLGIPPRQVRQITDAQKKT